MNGRAGFRRVLIVAPQFPPSNLAAVHRSRLFARHLPQFGWDPIVLTVDPKHYEEPLDTDLVELLPRELRVERVAALPTKPIRLVGDIAIRAFGPLLHRVLKIVDREKIDFLYLPIPPFFSAPIGRLVHRLRGTPYGIDYIDPWVHAPLQQERLFNKHWLSRQLGRVLEPFAVREARLITGVAEGYYEGVLERNPRLKTQAVIAAMPYGGEADDHRALKSLGTKPYLFANDGRFHLVYAGALLPRAFRPLEALFRAIAAAPAVFADVCFHFIGTGTSPDDPNGYTVRPIADRHGLWDGRVTEHPSRIPYLDVLAHLNAANGIFVLGSTEPHYTPSKVYQGVLSEKPVLAVLHQASSACAVLRETSAGRVLAFDGEEGVGIIESEFASVFRDYRRFATGFDPSQVDMAQFDRYSARNSTRILADALDRALSLSAGKAHVANPRTPWQSLAERDLAHERDPQTLTNRSV